MSQIKAGTVTVTNGSASVVGTGTSWLGNVTAGSMFSLLGSGVTYQVAADVTVEGQLTLTSNYGGTTATGQQYRVTTSFTPNLELPYPEFGDNDPTSILKRALQIIDAQLAGLQTDAIAGGVLFIGSSGVITGDSNNFKWDDGDNFLDLAGGLLGSPFVNPASGHGKLFGGAANGLNLSGRGTTYDVALLNYSGTVALGVTTNTVNLVAAGDLTFPVGTRSMTAGFPYVPGAAGTPTGTPTQGSGSPDSGKHPLYYDSSNNRLYVYSGNTWRYVAVAA